jgi:hypothetical protein
MSCGNFKLCVRFLVDDFWWDTIHCHWILASKSAPSGKVNIHKWSLHIPIIRIIIQHNFYG